MAATDRRSDLCVFCGSTVWLAEDGAWEDESGACGCGDGEHAPVGEAGALMMAAADMADANEEE